MYLEETRHSVTAHTDSNAFANYLRDVFHQLMKRKHVTRTTSQQLDFLGEHISELSWIAAAYIKRCNPMLLKRNYVVHYRGRDSEPPFRKHLAESDKEDGHEKELTDDADTETDDSDDDKELLQSKTICGTSRQS
jgi:hypothetical protein